VTLEWRFRYWRNRGAGGRQPQRQTGADQACRTTDILQGGLTAVRTDVMLSANSLKQVHLSAIAAERKGAHEDE
jgi:hypothetical protein